MHQKTAPPSATAAGSSFALEMTGICKAFPGVQALQDVSLHVRPGTVHALMGENGAGKSTLMKCLFGIYSPDAGEIRLQGRPVIITNAKDALRHGISMIHQELLPVAHRSVMENLWLGRYPKRYWGPIRLVDEPRMYRETVKLFAELKMEIDPRQWAIELSVSKLQSVEIAKAVSYNAKIIIMDEPTSSLTQHEVAHLFEIIRQLRRDGVAIIYISHKMEEILAIADEVSIMRDGRLVGTYPAAELTTELIIAKMVGRDLTHRFPNRDNVPGKVWLKVEDLTSSEPRSFKHVSFELRQGEILGIGGLVGAQRTELVEAIFGLRALASGRMYIGGKQVNINSPRAAKRHRIALLTEERRATGVFPILSVTDNTLMASFSSYKRRSRLLDQKRGQADVRRNINRFKIKTPSPMTLMQNLSGGNQQKVIFARWLLTEPEILILDEPTRGIDVGAKFDIYSIIVDLAKRGKCILMISSEMHELLGITDRVMVMCEGRVTGILDSRKTTQEEVMTLATQFM